MGDQDKSWVPHICYEMRVRLPSGWVNSSHPMLSTIPVVWRDQKTTHPNIIFV